MTIAQMEHRDAAIFSELLTATALLDRLEELLSARRTAMLMWRKNKFRTEMVDAEKRSLLVNRMTAAAMRRREIEDQILNVARQILADAAAIEAFTE